MSILDTWAEMFDHAAGNPVRESVRRANANLPPPRATGTILPMPELRDGQRAASCYVIDEDDLVVVVVLSRKHVRSERCETWGFQDMAYREAARWGFRPGDGEVTVLERHGSIDPAFVFRQKLYTGDERNE